MILLASQDALNATLVRSATMEARRSLLERSPEPAVATETFVYAIIGLKHYLFRHFQT